MGYGGPFGGATPELSNQMDALRVRLPDDYGELYTKDPTSIATDTRRSNDAILNQSMNTLTERDLEPYQ
jgi:hypothetical protein